MHSILIVDESDSEAEPRYKPFTNEEAVAVTTVTPSETAADRALASFKIKKPRHISPHEEITETPAKVQTKPAPTNKALIGKPSVKSGNAPKPNKKTSVQKNPVQRSSAKGKEKAGSITSPQSTSGTAETDSLADEDQVMGDVDDN